MSQSKDVRAFNHAGWSWVVTLFLVSVLFILWLFNFGPSNKTCCAAPTPPALVAPVPAPAPAPVDPSKQLCESGKVQADVRFATASAVLTPESKVNLNVLVPCLKTRQAQVIGHSDNVGRSAESKQRLSEKRAQAVAQYLESQGVPKGNLTAVGKGDAEPIADNSTEEGRAKNRRMEIVLKK